jgi:hypothetical protein
VKCGVFIVSIALAYAIHRRCGSSLCMSVFDPERPGGSFALTEKKRPRTGNAKSGAVRLGCLIIPTQTIRASNRVGSQSSIKVRTI